MSRVVLDASAVIALLKGERGASKVAGVLGDAAIGVFNHAEIVSHYVHLGAPIGEIRTMLGALPLTIIDGTESLSWDAGAMRAVTSSKGLTLGNRLCLALARQLHLPAYTADQHWKEFAEELGVKIVTIRTIR